MLQQLRVKALSLRNECEQEIFICGSCKDLDGIALVNAGRYDERALYRSPHLVEIPAGTWCCAVCRQLMR